MTESKESSIPFDENYFHIMMITCCAKPPRLDDSAWKRLRVINKQK